MGSAFLAVRFYCLTTILLSICSKPFVPALRTILCLRVERQGWNSRRTRKLYAVAPMARSVAAGSRYMVIAIHKYMVRRRRLNRYWTVACRRIVVQKPLMDVFRSMEQFWKQKSLQLEALLSWAAPATKTPIKCIKRQYIHCCPKHRFHTL